MRHRLGETRPRPLQDIRHPGGIAKEDIRQKQHGHTHQGRAKCTPGCFKQQNQADTGNRQILRNRQARTRCQIAVKDIDVKRAKRRSRSQNPVNHRDIGTRRAFERRIGHKGQKYGKSQMDRPRFGRVENTKTNDIGKRRCQPKLEQRPSHRNTQQNACCHACWLARTCIIFRNKILKILIRCALVRVINVGHYKLPV